MCDNFVYLLCNNDKIILSLVQIFLHNIHLHTSQGNSHIRGVGEREGKKRMEKDINVLITKFVSNQKQYCHKNNFVRMSPMK